MTSPAGAAHNAKYWSSFRRNTHSHQALSGTCRQMPDIPHRAAGRPCRAALATGVAGLALLVPTPGLADHDQEQHLEVGRPPAPPEDLLDRILPGLPEFRRGLPPFLRDTGLNLHPDPFTSSRRASAVARWIASGVLTVRGSIAAAVAGARRSMSTGATRARISLVQPICRSLRGIEYVRTSSPHHPFR